jgi:hypothetical protein
MRVGKALVKHIREVLRRSYFGPSAARTFAENFPRRPMGCLVAVERDGARQLALALERPPEKRFGGGDIPLGAEQEIDSLSYFVAGTVKISPAPLMFR